MRRSLVPLAIGMALLYAALAIGAANCLVLHAAQPPSHHHSQSHMAHSALCAWACQINPTVIVATPVQLVAVSAVVARLSYLDTTAGTARHAFLLTSRAPPLT